MKATIILSAALAAVVAAAPTPGTHTQPVASRQVAPALGKNTTLPGTFWLNGQEFNLRSPTAGHSPCTVDDDVQTCAGKIAAKWQMEGNYTTQPIQLTVPMICVLQSNGQDVGCTATFELDMDVFGCQLSNPTIVSHQDAYFCNSGAGCSQSFQFGHSTTDTNSHGYRIGSQLKAGASIGIVSTELSVSGDFNENWSNSSTTTTTVTRQYNMLPGDICAATTIQFSAQCQTALKSTYHPEISWDRGTLKLDDGSYTQDWNLCHSINDPTIINVVPAPGDAINQVCQALQSPSGATVDVGTLGGQGPWALEGCMFE